MTENLSPSGAAKRLRRCAIIPLCCGALAMTMAAASPGVHPDATLTQVAAIPVGNDPTAMAVDQATGVLYVTCNDASATGTVYAVDGATNTVTATIAVGKHPDAVGVDAATDTIYTASEKANTVSVIDGATDTVTATIPVANHPNAIAVDSASDQIFVGADGAISVIDGATGTVTHTITQGAGAIVEDMAVDPATKRLWVGTQAYSVQSYKLVQTITLTGRLAVDAEVLDPVTDTLYLASSANTHHGVQVVDLKTSTQGTFIRLGGKPFGLAFDQRNDTLFAAANRRKLIEISAKTDKATATVTVNAIPVAVNDGTDVAYAARSGSPTVYAYQSSPGQG